MVNCFKGTKSAAGMCPKKDHLGHNFESFVVQTTELRLGVPLKVLSRRMRWGRVEFWIHHPRTGYKQASRHTPRRVTSWEATWLLPQQEMKVSLNKATEDAMGPIF